MYVDVGRDVISSTNAVFSTDTLGNPVVSILGEISVHSIASALERGSPIVSKITEKTSLSKDDSKTTRPGGMIGSSIRDWGDAAAHIIGWNLRFEDTHCSWERQGW